MVYSGEQLDESASRSTNLKREFFLQSGSLLLSGNRDSDCRAAKPVCTEIRKENTLWKKGLRRYCKVGRAIT